MLVTAALDQMCDVLALIGAPARQRNGVARWRDDVDLAVSAARRHRSPRGLTVDDWILLSANGTAHFPDHLQFLAGERTHRTWRVLADHVMCALGEQKVHAGEVIDRANAAYERAAAAAKVYPRPEHQRQMAAARDRRGLAADWFALAAAAHDAGRHLITHENRIAEPIGHAIAAAGGLTNVARDKHYHQGAGR